MSDLPGVHATPDPADTELQALRRLRQAEASVERLQDALRDQEDLAERLNLATQTAAQTQQELADVQRELALARLSRGWRDVARAGNRRLRRLLGPAPHAVDIAPPDATAEPTEAHEFAWSDTRYREWIDLYDTLDEAGRRSLLAQVAEIEHPPLISIIFPVYNAPEEFLRAAIDSVRAQLYTNWELCIADDLSSLPHVAKVLDEYAASDARIRVVKRESNGHISACSNSALTLARGSWLCLMDHDDLLAEHALAVCALALIRAADPAILYSDEDHIDADGNRMEPYFKPDFDPLLMLGQNYFSHLCMIRKDVVNLVGGFREGYEGSQDWDLVLRSMEHLRPDQVVHVPHVLYHWRVHAESTAWSVSAKPYVVEASRQVVQDHLDRIGAAAKVVPMWGTSYNRINWALPDVPPKVSVIILPRAGNRLHRCIEGIRLLSSYPQIELIVLDDGGFRPPMRRVLHERFDWLKVVETTDDLSDAAERNLAARAAGGDVLCFVDDDVEVLSTSWLEEMVGTLSYPGIGCVGAKLFYPDLRIQHAGIALGIGGTVGHPHRLSYDRFSFGYAGHLRLLQCPSAVSWACMAVRREAFDAVDGFSDDHFAGLFGDVDFCLRLHEAGWRTAFTPLAEMFHFERPEDGRAADGANAVRFDRDIRYLHRRWGKWVENDPSYNPNLSLTDESLSLAWPPRRPFV